MKNFNWYFVFSFLFLPFLGFGNNVIEVKQAAGSGGDDGTYIPAPIEITINLNNPSGLYSNETFTFPTFTEPLYLIATNTEYDNLIVSSISLNDETYILSVNKPAKCYMYSNTFTIPERDLIRSACQLGATYVNESLTFSIVEIIDGVFQEPQNYFNRMVLGMTPSNGRCVTFTPIKTSLEISCVGDEAGERGDALVESTPYNTSYPKSKNDKLIKKIFPNPFSDRLEVSFIEVKTDREMKVFSIEGKLFYKKDLHDLNEIHLSTNTWKRGIYLVQITSNGNVETKKVVKF